jgi:hypothetical protein
LTPRRATSRSKSRFCASNHPALYGAPDEEPGGKQGRHLVAPLQRSEKGRWARAWLSA